MNFDRVLGLAGMVLAILFGLAPYKWPKLPRWITDLALVVAGTLIGIMVGPMALPNEASSHDPASFIRAGNVPDRWATYNPKQIIGKSFINERVILDNKFYQRCRFENVTFVYNGTTPIRFANNETFGRVQFDSDNETVVLTLKMLKGFDLLASGLQFPIPPGDIIEPPKRGP